MSGRTWNENIEELLQKRVFNTKEARTHPKDKKNENFVVVFEILILL